jgi:diguanylate cyclase (GGDEF)-like protein
MMKIDQATSAHSYQDQASASKLAHLQIFGMSAIAFSAVLVFLGCIAFIFQANRILDRHDDHRKAAEVSSTLFNILNNIREMESGQQRYLLTGNTQDMGPFQQGSLELRKNIAILDRIVPPDNDEDKTLVARLRLLTKMHEASLVGAASARERGAGDDEANNTGMANVFAQPDNIPSLIYELNARFQLRQVENGKVTTSIVDQAKLVFVIWVLVIAGGFGLAYAYGVSSRQILQRRCERFALDATHDALTGLPNRRYLHEWMGQVMARSIRHRESLGVLFIDLDGFSDINNTLGHEAGDAALVWASASIRSQLRGSDFLARLGGDEFVVITCGRASDQLEHLAGRLIEFFGKGSPMKQLPAGALGLSIGIAELDFDYPDADKLLFTADQAMYEAKRGGKRCYRVASRSARAVSV